MHLQFHASKLKFPKFHFVFSERFGDGETSQIGLDLEEVIYFYVTSILG